MSEQAVVDVARETIFVIIKTSAPLLLISLVVGLIISIFQTVTSIQEQTLTFVPKILMVFLAISLIGSWMLNNIVVFIQSLWGNFNDFIR